LSGGERVEADQRDTGYGTRQSVPIARTRGNGLAWLPDIIAFVAGAVGATAFEGDARWLCLGACALALASLGLRLRRHDLVQSSTPARNAIASLPSLLLLSGVVYAANLSSPGPASKALSTPTIRMSHAPPEARGCLSSEASQAYLDALYRRIDRTWDAQDTAADGGFAVLGFILDAEGGIRLSRVIDQSSEAYRISGTETLSRAAPFGPLTGEVACLAQIELRATLDRTSLR